MANTKIKGLRSETYEGRRDVDDAEDDEEIPVGADSDGEKEGEKAKTDKAKADKNKRDDSAKQVVPSVVATKQTNL